MIGLIGFDADDTLWHNEKFFRLTQESFAEMLRDHAEPDHLGQRLLEAEKRNLALYGFGIKGFMLSMIETALEVGDKDLPADFIKRILALGRDMLAHPIELLPHAQETLEALSGNHRLVLITKGDLFDQERKVAQSGLGDLFSGVEIVADKNADTYARIFTQYGADITASVMIGNSLKSDVIPMIDAGGWGVHVPHDFTWELEHAQAPEEHKRFKRIDHLGELPALIDEMLAR